GPARDAARRRPLERGGGRGDGAGPPGGAAARVEGEPPDGRARLDLAPRLLRVGQAVLVSPCPREHDAGHLRSVALHPERPRALRGARSRTSRHPPRSSCAVSSIGRYASTVTSPLPGRCRLTA